MNPQSFGRIPDGRTAQLFTLKLPSGLQADITDYGGTVVRATSGTNGIPSSDGTHHAVVTGGAYTKFGNYSSEFAGGYTTRVSVYLDTQWADGQGFDYSVASNNQAGNHLRDFVFNVAQDESSGQLWIAASNGSALSN